MLEFFHFAPFEIMHENADRLRSARRRRGNLPTDLQDALAENEHIEKQQAQAVSQEREVQERIERTLQALVRFPKEEAFQQKMKNAEGYAKVLLERQVKKRKNQEFLEKNTQAVINRQSYVMPTDLSERQKSARTYLLWQTFNRELSR